MIFNKGEYVSIDDLKFYHFKQRAILRDQRIYHNEDSSEVYIIQQVLSPPELTDCFKVLSSTTLTGGKK